MQRHDSTPEADPGWGEKDTDAPPGTPASQHFRGEGILQECLSASSQSAEVALK